MLLMLYHPMPRPGWNNLGNPKLQLCFIHIHILIMQMYIIDVINNYIFIQTLSEVIFSLIF